MSPDARIARPSSSQAYVNFLLSLERTLGFCALGRLTVELWPRLRPDLPNQIAGAFHDEFIRDVEVVERTWTEISITKSVDHLNAYMANVFASIVTAYPMRFATDPIPLSTALRAGSKDELVQEFAFLKADSLTYGGFGSMLTFLEKDLNVKLQLDPDLKQRTVVATAVRNVVVHNGGMVNQRFLDDTKWPNRRLGQPLSWTVTDALAWSAALREIALPIDKAIVTTFGKAFLDADRARNPTSRPDESDPQSASDNRAADLERFQLDHGSSGRGPS
jgi:hypothetical protein